LLCCCYSSNSSPNRAISDGVFRTYLYPPKGNPVIHSIYIQYRYCGTQQMQYNCYPLKPFKHHSVSVKYKGNALCRSTCI
jgi:hypothetical protein